MRVFLPSCRRRSQTSRYKLNKKGIEWSKLTVSRSTSIELLESNGASLPQSNFVGAPPTWRIQVLVMTILQVLVVVPITISTSQACGCDKSRPQQDQEDTIGSNEESFVGTI